MREVPITTGRPSATSSSSRRSSSRLCSTVLPKPIPGSSRIRSSRDPGPHRERHALLEERLDVVHHVVVAGVVLHRARVAQHVHQAAVGAGAGHDAGHLGVAAQGGHVVDERRAGVERPRRDAALDVSIEIWAPAPRSISPSITGITRRSSSASGTGSAPGPGRLAAHVEDRRALRLELEAVRDRRLGGQVAAAVGERVGRDVDHAHDLEVAPPGRARHLIGHRPWRSKYSRASSSRSRSRLLSTLIRNIQLIIHTISATITSPTPAPAAALFPWPITIPTTPAIAIATGIHTRVAASRIRPKLLV